MALGDDDAGDVAFLAPGLFVIGAIVLVGDVGIVAAVVDTVVALVDGGIPAVQAFKTYNHY